MKRKKTKNNPQLKKVLRQNKKKKFMHFFSHSGENNNQFFNRPHPGVVFTKKREKRKKSVAKYLITYNVYSNTANSHFFYFKNIQVGRHATTAGPITKSNKIIVLIIIIIIMIENFNESRTLIAD